MPWIPAHVPLRALRKDRGLTARALAELLADRGVRVDPDTILGIELGQKTAGIALRTAWAEEFSLRPGDIHMGPELRQIIAAVDGGDSDTGDSDTEKISA